MCTSTAIFRIGGESPHQKRRDSTKWGLDEVKKHAKHI